MGQAALGGVLARLRGAGGFGALGMNVQLGPNVAPRALAQVPATYLAARHYFDATGLAGIHVPSIGQALIEIGFPDPRKEGQALSRGSIEPTFDRAPVGLGSVHPSSVANRYCNSKGFVANRIVKTPTRRGSEMLEIAPMETAAERRRRKLALLCEQRGRAVVAEKSGLSSVALEQIIKGVLLPAKADGTRSPRSLGDRAARAIEAAFSLGEGWFDAADAAPVVSDAAMLVALAYDRMTPAEKMRLDRLMAAAMDVPLERQDVHQDLGGMSGLGDLEDTEHHKQARKKGS